MSDDETAYRCSEPEDWPKPGGKGAGGLFLTVYFLFIPALALVAVILEAT